VQVVVAAGEHSVLAESLPDQQPEALGEPVVQQHRLEQPLVVVHLPHRSWLEEVSWVPGV